MIAYISEQGAKIRREGERLIVCGQEKDQILFGHRLEQLILFGNVHLTAQARSLLLAKKIDTVFLSASGAYRGRLLVEDGENVFLRKRQYDLLGDASFQLAVAKAIVGAKLHNQITMLGRIKREHHLRDAAIGVEELKSQLNRARTEESLESLRGVEGAAAATYFHYFAFAFHKDWGFSKRVRRPPTDPVNVLLSLIYTLLVDRCYTACRLAGLDPFPGNLHVLEYGRKSLPLDLVEEFRTIIGDTLVLSLFNLRVLGQEDFESRPEEATDEEGGAARTASNSPLFLKREPLKKVLAAFVKKMETRFHHPHAGKEMSYTEAVNWQAREYRRCVEGDKAAYLPLIWH